MGNWIKAVEEEQVRTDLPDLSVGDTVEVSFKVTEGGKERSQLIKGLVIKKQNSGLGRTFTVRKISFGVGVEKTFPINSPKIAKIKVVGKGKVRRAKLYYIREKIGKKARVKRKH
ncbi:MAG: 50S ribosomal protein L19 [Terriglobia bacterium]